MIYPPSCRSKFKWSQPLNKHRWLLHSFLWNPWTILPFHPISKPCLLLKNTSINRHELCIKSIQTELWLWKTGCVCANIYNNIANLRTQFGVSQVCLESSWSYWSFYESSRDEQSPTLHSYIHHKLQQRVWGRGDGN